MRLTAIRDTDGGRAVYVETDKGQRLVCDAEDFFSFGIGIGDSIDRETYEELVKITKIELARGFIMRRLDLREHSRKELERKLAAAGYDGEISALALDRLCERGIIDDRRFAESAARLYGEQKNYGKRRVMSELLRRGVDKETAQSVLGDDGDSEEKALSFLKKTVGNKVYDEKMRRRASAAMIRAGYSWDDFRRAERELFDGQPFGE